VYCKRSLICVELASHPDVLEVSVIARAHPKWGERAMAFVILRKEAQQKWKGRHQDFDTELKKHARSRLPGFACPEWVEVVEDLPVSEPAFLFCVDG
jgi:acyl-CoA synthetase (AMP-forming)/AMP-acid ligase II